MNFEKVLYSDLGLNNKEINLLSKCENFGQLNHNYKNLITYLEDETFLDELNYKDNIRLVIVKEELKNDLKHEYIVKDEPQTIFWTLYDAYSKQNKSKVNTSIGKNNFISEKAYLADKNVIIGNNCKIFENVVIKEGVEIGDNTTIEANSVIGADGFQIKKTIYGVKHIKHNGKVKIGNNVTIGVLNNIHKGFMGMDTVIEDFAATDSHVHIAHNAKVGKRVTLASGTTLSGYVDIGEDVFVGIHAVFTPRVSICKGSFVGGGALVSKGCSIPTTYLAARSRIKDFVR